MSEQKHTPEPFGYFKAEPFGWTDCGESDEKAIPLYEQAVVEDLKGSDAVRDRLAVLLSDTAIALKGEEAALQRHSWHDLPVVALAAMIEIEMLKNQRDELLGAAEAIEINAEECLDFDECTAMLIPIDDYHKLMEAIASAKDQFPDATKMIGAPATANYPHGSLGEAVEAERGEL
jgi:hypothetical protein